VILEPGIYLNAEQCAVLARLLGDGVRRARARGEMVGLDALAIVDELAAVGRAYRVASAIGSSEVPTRATDLDDEDDLSVQEVAHRLDVSDRWVRQLITDGRLSGRKHRGAWSVPTVEVERLAARRAPVEAA
jgi:excisionase family DNA binding protein